MRALLRERMAGKRAIYLPPNDGVSLVYVAIEQAAEDTEIVDHSIAPSRLT